PANGTPPSLLYRRPAFNGDLAIFYDLVGYCPGLSTSAADVRAVLEAEAHEYVPPKKGEVDASARELLGRARDVNWQTWTRDAKAGAPALTVTFDGAGRFVCDRILPFGLKEQIICDGQTLWHLYPQLQIGAKRTMTPHHRAALAALIPWCVSPIDDLARNADIRIAGPGSRSVMIVPHYEAKLFEYIKEVEKLKKSDPKKYERLAAPEWHRVHLVIADDGQLLERQLARMPENKIVASQFVERSGRIRFLGKDYDEVLAINGKLTPAQQPNLVPNTKGMVVLPLPYRASAHVQKALKLDKRRVEDLRFEEGLQLFAASIGA